MAKWILVALKGKRPIKKGWNTSRKSDKIKKGNNIGVKLAFSGLCCFDIDDLKKFKKLPGGKDYWKLIKKGCRYQSGVPNRIKVLFRIKKPFPTILLGKGTGQFRCSDAQGGTVQDVIPPSIHPSGSSYTWIDDPKSVPYLPKQLQQLFKTRKKKFTSGKYKAPYVTAYNEWAADRSHRISDEIERTGGYNYTIQGFQRKGSYNKVAIVVYSDDDAYNFSDNIDQPIPHGPMDFYKLLVINRFKGNEAEARKWVCNHEEIRKYVDREYSNRNNGAVGPTAKAGKARLRRKLYS